MDSPNLYFALIKRIWRLKIWQDMIHIFSISATLAPESRKGIEVIGDYIQEFFNWYPIRFFESFYSL